MGPIQYLDENFIFEKRILKYEITLPERILIYAFYSYLIVNETINIDELNAWMRVIYNLVENTYIDHVEDYHGTISKGIKPLLQHSADILNYIEDENNEIKVFFRKQVVEERIKAILIHKGEKWGNVILEAEKHGFLKGQIGFLFSFSGVMDYYEQNHNCDWIDEEDNRFLDSFSDYYKNINAIFDNEGLRNITEFKWERALLTKGDFTLRKGLNTSFLMNKHRDISWKRLLRENNDKTKLIKELFDDKNFNINDIEGSLKVIIENHETYDWKYYFIHEPSIMEKLGNQKAIRKNTDNFIYVMSGVRLSGSHFEYYSFAYFLSYIDGGHFEPFTDPWYYNVSGDNEKPCAVLGDWEYEDGIYAIDIRYISDWDIDETNYMNKYEIRFFNRNDDNIQSDIVEKLEHHGFELSNEYTDQSYLVYCDDMEMTNEKILSICNSLKELMQ